MKLSLHDIKRKCLSYPTIRKLLRLRPKSSISDDSVFPNFCLSAAQSDRFFEFRREPILRSILEHTTFDQGNIYLSNILNLGFDHKFVAQCTSNDVVGNPDLFYYENLGLVCPSTLRYANVLADLIIRFGDLAQMSIIEIGGGYGGQARIVKRLFPSCRYSIIDLPEVLLLTKRYLNESSPNSKYDFISAFDFDTNQSDLILSNYAFSELNRDLQFKYISNIISKATHGYIIYNSISSSDLNSLTVPEFLDIFPSAVAVPESPLTWPNNKLIFW